MSCYCHGMILDQIDVGSEINLGEIDFVFCMPYGRISRKMLDLNGRAMHESRLLGYVL